MGAQISLQRMFKPNNSDVKELLQHFFGNNPYYAMAKEVAGEITYQPVDQPLTPEILATHLKGEIVLGSYHVNKKDNTVNWLGWDIDSNDPSKAREFTKKICSKLDKIPYGIEFSGNKGYHVLIFLTEPMPADKAKQIAEHVRGELPKSGKTHVECYPKQGSLTQNRPKGSLLKIPLGRHPRTHNQSKFVDPANGWEAGEELDPIPIMTNLADPASLIKLLTEEADINKLLVELLVPFWVDGERHNISLYLSGYLAHLGWGMQTVEDLVQEIAIAAGDEDVRNRVLSVKDTFRAISDGRAVKGFSGLNELLPGAVIRTLGDLATRIITPTMVKQIDGIRLQKGAVFEKIRATANLIWMDLQEKGETVRTTNDDCYWYNSDTHLLTSLDSLQWQSILYNEYGMNPAESFGRQVTQAIKLRTISEAKIVTIQHRTLWTGEELLVNLGTAIVYVLDGKDIKVSYNGECGYLFRTDTNSEHSIEPDFGAVENVWERLTEDISFYKSADAPSTPEEQRELLKAWILAFFFQELMPTKPLLLGLGVPGSGKTTAMRRIMKVLESPSAEVLEIAGDKPDSLRASISSHRLLVLDNLEKSGVKWLVDTLNRLATGANIELRELYKTNETYVLKPNCFVAMTAVSMPFSEETLFSRILPLEMQQISSPLPEYFLQKQLVENIDGIWADLLNKLNNIVAALLKDKSHQPPISSRLADFTVFCKRIENSGVINGEVLMRGLRSLVDRQRMTLMEASPFVFALEQWLNSGDTEIGNYHTFQEFYAIVEPLARSRKLQWRWNSASSLERHIMAMKEPLEKLYHAEFREYVDPNTARECLQIRFRK